MKPPYRRLIGCLVMKIRDFEINPDRRASSRRRLAHKVPLTVQDGILIVLAIISAFFYGLLMMEQPVHIILYLPIIIAWLLYWLKTRQPGASTPLDIAILALLLVAILGAFVTPFKELFLPRISGLLLGVSIYFMIVIFFRYRQRLPVMIFALLFLSLIIAALGLTGTDWPVGNNGLFDRVYRFLPSLVDKVGIERINKNTVGGALTFFPPLLLSLLLDKGAFGRLKSHYQGLSTIPEFVYKLFVFLCFAFCLGVLLLTQSRGAWLGCALGIYSHMILKDRRFLWMLLPLVGVFLYILFVRADGNLLQLLSLLDTSKEATLPGRLEIWGKSLMILRDFPLTGIGLGAFGEAYREYFASIVLPSASDVVHHAHNTLLSVAVEVGLPGVLVYATLLGGFGAMSWKALSYRRTINRVLGVGVACGLFAFMIYGLFDAFTLGRNLEIILWIFLGCGSALYVHDRTLSFSEVSYQVFMSKSDTSEKDKEITKQQLKDAGILLLSWLIIALLSLAMVNYSTLLALMLAIAAGLVVGFGFVRGIEKKKYGYA